DLTHGTFGERNSWKSCKQEIGVPIEYLHRDEIPQNLQDVVGDQIPSVVARTNGSFVLLLKPEVIGRCKGNVSDLKGRLRHFAAINDLSLPG
ncbi:MAG: hypothetical protein AAF492_22225, partial [Verrucomicrobiota bacterium]